MPLYGAAVVSTQHLSSGRASAILWHLGGYRPGFACARSYIFQPFTSLPCLSFFTPCQLCVEPAIDRVASPHTHTSDKFDQTRQSGRPGRRQPIPTLEPDERHEQRRLRWRHRSDMGLLCERRHRPRLTPIQIPDLSCISVLSIPPAPTSPDRSFFPRACGSAYDVSPVAFPLSRPSQRRHFLKLLSTALLSLATVLPSRLFRLLSYALPSAPKIHQSDKK